MPKKTFDYIFEFIEALGEISKDVFIAGYFNCLKALNEPVPENSNLLEKDIEALSKHKRVTKKKYVKIFRGLYEENYESLFNENHDWILNNVVIPSTRTDIYLPLTNIYREVTLESKVTILKYIYLICISIEDDDEIKDSLKNIYKTLEESKIQHHEKLANGDDSDPGTGNPLADMIAHMTTNMPMPEDPNKPDFAQMFGYVTHMMGDPKMQKNISALTQQLERDGMQSFFSQLQTTFEQVGPKGPQTDQAETKQALPETKPKSQKRD